MVEKMPKRHSAKQTHGGRSSPHVDWRHTASGELENTATSLRSSQPNASRSSDQDVESRLSSRSTSFVNHALLLWQEQRREWVGDKTESQQQKNHEPVLNPETTYNELLATSRRFPQPIPLPEMVEFLVNVWEQEGLYNNVF